ncbi:ribose 5-phosphate isomerase [Neoconidiobolus thromboides FSU 785]|nr:ribose 5-phosphate isomerase [Neoconidiobolus thromboides FSU 785]
MSIEASKKLAAYQAVNEYVLPLLDNKSNNQPLAIGIGSGSTIVYVIDRLVEIRDKLIDVKLVPTSFQSKQLILNNGFTLGSLEEINELEVAIDGADEVDSNLNAIKGGGACQLQEKIVASSSKKFILIADYRKNSKVLGENWKQGVPIEVIPYALNLVTKKITSLGGKPTLRMSGGGKAGPVVTDNGMLVIDADFGLISNPKELLNQLIHITGVVEVGLFCDMATVAYFGNQDGTVTKVGN